MPPVNKNHKKISFPCFTPTVSQKRDMYPQLKMLLHLNGAIPSDPALKSFWDKNAQEKLQILSLELLNTKYDSKSIFSQLSDFNKNLIQLTIHKCPTAFKKGELLHSWYSKQGNTFLQFREHEYNRWSAYVKHMDQYEKDFIVNKKSFDEKKVKNSLDLKDLCYSYYSKYSQFQVTNFNKLIQSVMVNQHPLVG